MPSIVIIGGGPAGASAAIGLAHAGWRTTLLEARAFPRVKVCGEFISPAATDILESIIPPDALRAVGARMVDQLIFELGPRTARWRMPRPAWALSRHALDEAMLSRAAQAGVRVLQPASVLSVEHQTDQVRVRGSQGEDLQADLVIHADGCGRHDPAGPTPARPGVLGHKCHLRIPGGLEGLHMRSAKGAYVGLVEVEQGLATCALVARRELIARHAGDADAMLKSLWPAYQPAWRTAAGELGAWLACPVGASRYIEPGHPRSLRIGNAAAAVEPVGGEGIGMALWAGTTLAGLLGPGSADSATIAQVRRAFGAAYRARLRFRIPACRLAAEVLMRPRLAGLLWPLLWAPGLSIQPWYALTGKPLAAAR